MKIYEVYYVEGVDRYEDGPMTLWTFSTKQLAEEFIESALSDYSSEFYHHLGRENDEWWFIDKDNESYDPSNVYADYSPYDLNCYYIEEVSVLDQLPE